MLDQLINVTIFFVLGYVAGIVIFRILDLFRLIKESKQIIEEQKEILEQAIHIVKQEQQGDMYYWFDQDDDKFIAQGRTMEEIVQVLKERFPKHIFVLNENEMLVGPNFDRIHNFSKE